MNTINETMTKVAQEAIADGLDLDAFMKAAWRAFVDANPGMREELELVRVTRELDGLRKAGLVGQA